MFDFNKNTKNYRDTIDKNISITGANSYYFAEFKVNYSAKLLTKKNFDARKILDFGCGDGVSEEFFVKYFPRSEIFGVDVAENFVALAKSKKLTNTNFCSFDGENLPFEENFFDYVFVACVFHHINAYKRAKVLKEIHRVIKPGGYLHIYEHNPLNPLTNYQVSKSDLDVGVTLIKPKELSNKLADAGFKNIKTNYIMFFPRWRIFTPFHFIEKYLEKAPLGGQYVIEAIKSQ